MPDEPQDEVIVREFQAELSEGDGRTIDARIVPYNTPTRVVDTVDNGGNGIPYTETWLPGAFDRQTGAVNRVEVWLNFEHQPGLQGIIGHGATLESRDDALYGTFRVHENADGDKALQMVREGILTGISLEAKPLRSRRLGDVVERLRAHLEKVSLCRIGAYEDATVLAVRKLDETQATEIQPEPDEPAVSEEAEPGVSEEAELAEEAEPALVGRMQVEAVKAELERTSLAEESLQRIGYEPLLVRAISREPWDGSAARFTDEQYEASCLVLREGDAPLKERASLPILEPDGTVNANALANAAAVLTGARGGLRGVSPEQKSAAARKLIRFHSQAGMEPSSVLRQVAAR